MPDALGHMLTALAELSSADRQAVLRQLSAKERKLLEQLSAPKPPTSPPPLLTKPAAPACSPWLSKHLARIAEADRGEVTEAARHAVRDLLAGAGP